jgi:hypothetical protein
MDGRTGCCTQAKTPDKRFEMPSIQLLFGENGGFAILLLPQWEWDELEPGRLRREQRK